MSLPPNEIPLGAMRFNSDSQKLEYWNGSAWFQIQTFSPNLDGGARGVMGGGAAPSPTARNAIHFITISTSGDPTDFGDLTQQRSQLGASASRSRAVFVGGFWNPSTVNNIDFITISSTGNATDFGDATTKGTGRAGVSNGTRGVHMSSKTPTNTNICLLYTSPSPRD